MIKLKILIVEDDFANTFLLSEFLRQKGLSANVCTNGEDAVDYVKNNNDVDLIFMDLKLPVLNGLEATRQIRLISTKCLIISQTAFANSETRTQVFEAGADAFFPKPLDLEAIWSFIESKFKLSDN
jgi:CheY-like chemotaxis protein